jgi:hypothetical protein
MASFCNDERVLFGVMCGHERKTLRLSDRGFAAAVAVVRDVGVHRLPRSRQRHTFNERGAPLTR